jgi:hypothetical protein
VSVEEAVSPPAPAERKKSLASASEKDTTEEKSAAAADDGNDTDDDVDKEDLIEVIYEAPKVIEKQPEQVVVVNEPEVEVVVESKAPVPVERKASVPELTPAEVELSKRETVHLDEAEKAEVLEEVTRRKSSSASSADHSVSSEEDLPEVQVREPSPEVQELAMPAMIIEHDDDDDELVVLKTNGSNQFNNTTPPEVKVASPSSSEDEEEEPAKPVVEKPKPKPEPVVEVASHCESPVNGRRSAGGDVSKIYTTACNNNNSGTANNNNNNDSNKGERTKPNRDITQIYTQTIAKASPPASPKVVARSKPASDITKLYTGKFEAAKAAGPLDKYSPPKKHNMSTAVDKDAIRRAYDDVRSDTSDTEWAVFKFDENNRLGVTATGNNFADFKSNFGNDDRGFGYIRIMTGDEMSKRSKFILVTWVGPSVSVMKKAKMSTDKALMKDVIQNMSVEIQLENHGEFSHDHFKMQVDKASGARYGTGVRDL